LGKLDFALRFQVLALLSHLFLYIFPDKSFVLKSYHNRFGNHVEGSLPFSCKKYKQDIKPLLPQYDSLNHSLFVSALAGEVVSLSLPHSDTSQPEQNFGLNSMNS
jgi:hypothetical protein